MNDVHEARGLIALEIRGSATTASLGFPLKVVTPSGTRVAIATDEAHAHRIIDGFRRDLANSPHYATRTR